MDKQSEVKLFGMWASCYCTRIHLALKLKGIPYEYMEEDLTNKSELLLKYNPVLQKVPVFVHEGKAIAESLVILEYIDDFWNTNTIPKLFPEDPYERSKLRFWANFYDQKLIPSTYPIIKSQVKEQEKALEDFSDVMKVFEEGLQRDFPGKSPFFNGDTLGYLGVVVGSTVCDFKAFNETVTMILDPGKHPIFMSLLEYLQDHPLLKEALPPHEKLVVTLSQRLVKNWETD